MIDNVIKFGIIGIGKIGTIHSQSSRQLNNTEFIAAYHPNIKKAKKFASSNKIKKLYDDLDSFLNNSEIYAIDICTPTHTHYDLIIKCLDAGKKVLVEKPITRTLQEFDELVKYIGNSSKNLMVAQYCRFIPEYKMAKKIIARGEIGTPISVRAHRRVSAPIYGEWFFDEKKSGGIILDLMIHDIDAVIWMLGDSIKSIYSCANNFNLENFDTPDSVTVVIKFNKGTIATISGTWILPKEFYTPNQLDTMLEVFGEKGVIEINDRSDAFMKVFTSENGVRLQKTDPLKIYKAEISHFSNCLLKNESFQMDFNSIRLSLDTCLKALESYKTGEIIKNE